MAAMMKYLTTALMLFFLCTCVYAGGITDTRITAEVVLDGMTHYDADLGLKDYKVDILEVTRETSKAEVVQREKVFYFMAPNVYLTLVGEKPESLANDASFMLLLSQHDLTREQDAVVLGEPCYKVLATPKDSAKKKYTKTYYVSKADFRKIRIESVRSEMDNEFIHYTIDYIYDKFPVDGEPKLLVSRSESKASDNKGNPLMEQSNAYTNYKFNNGLTQDFFEKILKEYNIYYSEGT